MVTKNPLNKVALTEVSQNNTECFSQKIKHLIKFEVLNIGKWIYQFASHICLIIIQ